MSGLNNLPQNVLVVPIDGTAAHPPIQMGGGLTGSSGTGMYGDTTAVKFSVGGTLKATINSTGIVGTVTGTASLATSLAGGLGGQIPYQSAANVTAMLANGTAGQHLRSNGTTAAPSWESLSARIIATASSAGAGGTATESMVVAGLLTTDTILSVVQKTPGANSLPLLGYSTITSGHITCIWSADPGAGSVVLVTVLR